MSKAHIFFLTRGGRQTAGLHSSFLLTPTDGTFSHELMARQYDLRYQKRHPVPGDPVPLVSGRLDEEESQNLPLSLADDISGDVILSPQFPTLFARK